MKKIELLSPAGSFEALQAAVMCGADAVYLGGLKFGARAFASNFDNDTMIKAVNYAHLYGVKIYVTVNTLIYENEIESFLKYINFLNSIGVDAFIIQDLGMMHLLREVYPQLELHASTQMHIHNIESLNLIKSLGVKRVVLPREFSISKISEFKESSGMDVEVFVHGALCISYSGECLMSSLIGGRSANRGECAGSCRLPYQLIEEENGRTRRIDVNGDYPLSTKDLNTLENINEILDSGVDSLKIEGRMKRPEYVALVTTLYRKAIDDYYNNKKFIISESDINDLKSVYNREFTKGHILNEKNNMNPIRPNHMGISIGRILNIDSKFISIKLDNDLSLGDGIRILSSDDTGFTVNKMYKKDSAISEAFKGDIIKIDKVSGVNINDVVVKTTDVKLLKRIQEYYQNNNRKIKLSAKIICHIDKYMQLFISDGVYEVSESSEIMVSKALKLPVTKEVILEKLNKINDTPFVFNNIDIEMDEDIFIPLPEINSLKRKCLDEISKLRLKRTPDIINCDYNVNVPDVYDKSIKIKSKVRTYEQYRACKDNNIDTIYVEDMALYLKIKDDKRVIYCYPRVRKSIVSIANSLVGDIGAIKEGSTADYALNVVNSYTAAFLYLLGAKTVTLSYEMTNDNIKFLIEGYKKKFSMLPNLEVIIYGRIEAMITEYCPLNMYISKSDKCSICKSDKKYYLRDRFKNDYLLGFNNCMMTVYNYKKLNIVENVNRLKEMGITNFRLNFVDEDYSECVKIINTINNNL
jgi:putative protease